MKKLVALGLLLGLAQSVPAQVAHARGPMPDLNLPAVSSGENAIQFLDSDLPN